jgi:hypothetical protein
MKLNNQLKNINRYMRNLKIVQWSQKLFIKSEEISTYLRMRRYLNEFRSWPI